MTDTGELERLRRWNKRGTGSQAEKTLQLDRAIDALEAAQARVRELEKAALKYLADAGQLADAIDTARREALEEAAKVNWVEAPYVPREWEGKEAWKYVDIANSPSRRVTLDMVPHGYSRDEDHCGGVWFALFTPPAPPPCALMEKDNANR